MLCVVCDAMVCFLGRRFMRGHRKFFSGYRRVAGPAWMEPHAQPWRRADKTCKGAGVGSAGLAGASTWMKLVGCPFLNR